MTSLQSAFALPSPGERRKGDRRALFIVETLVSTETVGPKSLLQREKDRKRG
jgi:hypothetical protein